MPNPNPGTIYVLTNGSNSSTGSTINGCKIKETTNDYELYLQNASTYVQKLPGPLPVTFEDVTITQGNNTSTWDLYVTTLPSATDAGMWTTPSQHAARPEDVPPQSGEFTAQSGGAVAGEKAASSSKAS